MRELPLFARNLNSALHRLRVRQSDLACALGVSRAIVSLWARGMRKPTPESAKALARELGVDPIRFMHGKVVDS